MCSTMNWEPGRSDETGYVLISNREAFQLEFDTFKFYRAAREREVGAGGSGVTEKADGNRRLPSAMTTPVGVCGPEPGSGQSPFDRRLADRQSHKLMLPF